TPATQPWAQERARAVVPSLTNNFSAIPARIKATAVAGFMATSPGRRLFRLDTLHIQPRRTALPITLIATLARPANERSKACLRAWGSRGSGSQGRAFGVTPLF